MTVAIEALQALISELTVKVAANNAAVIQTSLALQSMRDAYDNLAATQSDPNVTQAQIDSMAAVVQDAVNKVNAATVVLTSVSAGTALPAAAPPELPPAAPPTVAP